jgi:hypothetical protein
MRTRSHPQQLGDFKKTVSKIISPILGTGNVVIDIKTQITPDIHLDINKIITDPDPNPILKLAKPRVTFKGFGFSKTKAPWGEPTKNYVPAVILTIILSYLLIFYLGYRLGK